MKHLLSLLLVLILCGCTPVSNTTIQPSKENPITIKQIQDDDKEFSVIEVDPALYDFEIIENANNENERKSISEIHKAQKSIFSFNGSFFSKDFKPLGLLVSKGKTLNTLTRSKLQNAVFWLDKSHQPHIDSIDEYKKNSAEVDFAIQNGPLLIKDGKVTVEGENEETASRTAIGITENGKIIVIFLRFSLFKSENLQSLHDFATTLNNNPEVQSYHLKSLLNLDGGSSTGFALDDYYSPELELVQNIIVTKPRK